MFLCNGALGWLGEHCEISESNSHGLNLRLEIIRGFWVCEIVETSLHHSFTHLGNHRQNSNLVGVAVLPAVMVKKRFSTNNVRMLWTLMVSM